jgi:GMP synthase (glutamine-hydrolysing)
MRPVLVVKTGSALPETRARRGDFHEWIADAMGCGLQALHVVSVFADEPLPDPAAFSGVVVTGSPAMVSAGEAWSLRTAAWLTAAVARETAVLGICYGHQLLAQALGGSVGPNPRGRQIGTVEVEILPQASSDPLFGALPARILAHTTHLESVLELPRGARLLAANELDPHQAFGVGACAWGVQFHPEFDADVMRGYLEERRGVLEQEGHDPEALLSATRECPDGTEILRRFAELIEVATR